MTLLLATPQAATHSNTAATSITDVPRAALWAAWQARDADADWTAKHWFADAAQLRANDFNLSASRYRPLSKSQAVHRNPRELLAELRAIEAELLEEIDALDAMLAEGA